MLPVMHRAELMPVKSLVQISIIKILLHYRPSEYYVSVF
jgi:hypothetical protein